MNAPTVFYAFTTSFNLFPVHSQQFAERAWFLSIKLPISLKKGRMLSFVKSDGQLV